MPTGQGMHKNFGPDNKAAQSVEGQQRVATINANLESNAATTTTTTAATTAKGRRRRRHSRAMRKSRRRGRRGTRRR
jgi:hypothetical protein